MARHPSGDLRPDKPLGCLRRSPALRWTTAGQGLKLALTRGKRMKDFAGKFAVITGGGTGMGRELARQLVAEGCSVAMCDLSEANMAETARLCAQEAAQGAKVTTHIADVSIEEHINRFRDEVTADQETDRIHLLFNNAG